MGKYQLTTDLEPEHIGLVRESVTENIPPFYELQMIPLLGGASRRVSATMGVHKLVRVKTRGKSSRACMVTCIWKNPI